MRTLIAGAGAVGGYFGGLLASRGRDVTFLARGAHAAAMREHGLHIDSHREGHFVVRARVVTSLAEASETGPYDLVLVCVKSLGLPELARELAAQADRLFTPAGVACPLLNGVESEDVLARALGRERVVGGVAHVGSEVTAPGHVKHTTRGEILVAPLAGTSPERARAVSEFLIGSGVPGEYNASLGFIAWRKLVWNNAFNAVTALANCTMGEAARHPRLRELLRSAMAETVAVATAEGVTLPEGIIDVMIGLGEQYGDARTSMHQDVLAGRPTEHEALNGVVCRLGRRHGIPTPTNDALYALLDGKRA